MIVRQDISERIRLLYFIAACVVVSIHCSIETSTIGFWQGKYMKYCTKWAVPFFFFMSGVFARNSSWNSIDGFIRVAKKKVYSLIFPYGLWCVIGIVLRFPLIH